MSRNQHALELADMDMNADENYSNSAAVKWCQTCISGSIGKGKQGEANQSNMKIRQYVLINYMLVAFPIGSSRPSAV
jgi:hypothetical protein